MLSFQADNISVDLIAMLELVDPTCSSQNQVYGTGITLHFSAMYSLKVPRIVLDGACNVSASFNCFDWISYSQIKLNLLACFTYAGENTTH